MRAPFGGLRHPAHLAVQTQIDETLQIVAMRPGAVQRCDAAMRKPERAGLFFQAAFY